MSARGPDKERNMICASVPFASFHSFLVCCFCSSPCRGAGTDANVYIELYGNKGSVGETRLDDKAVRLSMFLDVI